MAIEVGSWAGGLYSNIGMPGDVAWYFGWIANEECRV